MFEIFCNKLVSSCEDTHIKTELVEPHVSFGKEAATQLIKNIRNTRVSCVPSFDKPCGLTLHPLNLSIVVLLIWVPNSGAILPKSANQRKVSSLLKFLWAALQVATQNGSLELALFAMDAICFDHSKSLLRVNPKYLASMASSSTCPELINTVCINNGLWHSSNLILYYVKKILANI